LLAELEKVANHFELSSQNTPKNIKEPLQPVKALSPGK
jgi:hypothetical protein